MSYQPADIVLCHSSGAIGWLIRFGQWIRHPRTTHWYEWNHVGIIDEVLPDGDATVIQAVARGVTNNALLSTIAPGGRYQVVPLPADVMPLDVLAFASAQVGVRYGFLTIFSIGVNLLTPSFIRLDLRRSGTWICSALGAFSMLSGGWEDQFRDWYQVKPADVAQALGASSELALSAYKQRTCEMTFKKLLGYLAPYVGAFLASGLAIANSDLTKLEDAVLAGGPAVVAAIFNGARHLLEDVHA